MDPHGNDADADADRSRVSARRLTRRTFLRATTLALTLPAATALLAACGGAAPTTQSAAPTATLGVAAGGAATTVPPTRAASPTTPAGTATRAGATAAASGATAAAGTPTAGFYPSPAPNVPDAYTTLPAGFTSVNAVPGKGGKVNAFLIGYNPPVPGRTSNKYWQELEKRLGATFEPTITPAASYVEKLAAIVASGDIPDLTLLQLEYAPDQNRLMLQGAYTDLTPYLTGDALKNYPNLARFPAALWKNVARKGKIYGVPVPNLIAQNTLMFRQDWAEKVGFGQMKSSDDFYNCMVAFAKNDPDGNGKTDTYGLGSNGSSAFSVSAFLHMFRVPNTWRKNADGTLTHMIETDEYKQAVTFMKRLYDGGGFHPDIATIATQQSRDGFVGSKIGAYNDGLTALATSAGLRAKIKPLTPAANVTAWIPPGFDGGKASFHTFPGYNSVAVIPAKVGKDAERAKELLRIIDYFAAPLGSQEWLFLKNGIQGVHYNPGPDGSPMRTDLGSVEIGDLPTIMTNPVAFYYPDTPDAGPYLQGVTKDLLSLGVDNPIVGLFSQTDASKAGELSQFNRDNLTSLVAGRDPLSAYDTWVQGWRSRGGDQIRKEYQDALSASQ
jgi:putative aldouronate transport system substrate-binding protein